MLKGTQAQWQIQDFPDGEALTPKEDTPTYYLWKHYLPTTSFADLNLGKSKSKVMKKQ